MPTNELAGLLLGTTEILVRAPSWLTLPATVRDAGNALRRAARCAPVATAAAYATTMGHLLGQYERLLAAHDLTLLAGHLEQAGQNLAVLALVPTGTTRLVLPLEA
jgi:hypothetical protein